MNARTQVPSEIKPIEIKGCAEDAHFDGVNVGSITSDLEIWGPKLDELAGPEVKLAKVRPIDFSVIPRQVSSRCTNSEIATLLKTSQTLCLEIRDVGALKERRGAASLQVDAFLQNLFLEVRRNFFFNHSFIRLTLSSTTHRYFPFQDTMTLLVLGFRPILSPGKKSSIFFLGSPENTQLQPSPVLLRVSEQRTRKQNHLPYLRIPCKPLES